MPKFCLMLVLACLLVSCGVDMPLPGSTRAPATSSQKPVIVTRTPALATATITPTAAPTLTPTASPTATPEPPKLELSILGCDTSIDLAHQMGEVTNAYVLLANTGQSAASNVCALLSASDESRHTRITWVVCCPFQPDTRSPSSSPWIPVSVRIRSSGWM